ncbi:protein LONGIFOLIA 1 isoform X1 [Ricinus communis]|uniref:protein LONGIFOLIA 1 isoform X1 n=1 Tax=Ricinus communis TaxID=3988 RepID=UPI00201A5A0A|nr:protein LONGIFOLIA 1 isoform X1 [Ricinus communis]XP_025012346.2 protein LONGIFOLIA 1 isoform X1 [Ricinus communis]XP_025012348.2 protein LONGIFOLIA 1 isoform X1 [Ricinus communis]XP_048228489.1 protein LONGIFOLIA 1 isoform X1 [Ricinus communis]
MAAKLLHSLADDNSDLQKQIGCMTGIFQLFDRHHALTGRRLSHRRLPPPGDLHLSNGSSERESFNGYHRPAATDMNLSRNLNERQRSSTESARPSFSSSCSSMSSLDYNKPAQSEASSSDRIIFPETPSRDAVLTQPSTSPHFGRQSLDLRDVVKGSMYREATGLSVKTSNKEEAIGHGMKHKDSPRPLQLSKSVDGSYGNGKKGKQNTNTPVDLKESLKVLAKLREAPWYYNESRERPQSSYESKDGFSYTSCKDVPRFSYDGREMNRLSFESRDTIKSTLKLKELPRLSLDSRVVSMQGSNSEPKASNNSKDLRYGANSNEKVCDLQQPLGTQKRPSNVVAKLMGLEALPDSASTSSSQSGLTRSFPVEHSDSFSIPLKPNDLNRPVRIPKSPRSLSKEPISPRWKNPDLIMKPISRLPIEPAPWKQLEGSRASQKPAKLSAKTSNPFPTVYSEIEKRLKDLEFNQSGKDLRALKQILEAMQAKGLLETRKEEGSNFGSQRDCEPSCTTSPGQKPRLLSQRNEQTNYVSASSARSSSLRSYESPIVIMKPAKLVEKSSIHASSVIPIDGFSDLQKTPSRGHADYKNRSANSRTAKDQFPRLSHRDSINSNDKKGNVRNRSTQSSTRPQQLPKESTTSSLKSSGSVSPRLQQKKLELEKRSRPPTPPSDSNKPRRQSNKMLNELGSPGGKNRPKSHKLPTSDDQLSQISNESRTSSHQGDDISLQSDNTVVFDLKTDMEVTSTEQPNELNIDHSPSSNAVSHVVSGSEQNNPTPRLEEDGTLADFAVDTPEHPSPISVLDASVYRDDALSPVKQIPNLPKGDSAEASKDQWDPADNFLSDSVGSVLTSEISRKKLQNVENLVKKLRRLNSTHDEASTDYIASLCENTNPDHRYISEILLASGLLLRDLGSGMTTFQLHSSGHPINPELFFVLEQTKASTLASKEECNPGKTYHSKPNPERFHRKLIFDAVNEMIVKKLALEEQSPEPWLKSDNLAKKTLSAQKLLKELCSEIEQLQDKKSECSLEDEEDDLKGVLWDDVMRRSESWTDFHSELSGVVLDVERSIFKDLVDEIVIGEAAGSRIKPGRRRQLFAK